MYIPSMTPSHPARRASIGLITKFQRGARGAVFRDTLILPVKNVSHSLTRVLLQFPF